MLRKLASPAWAMLEYCWYPLLLFAATPWFLHRLGTEQYGQWMLLIATLGLGGVLNSGTGAATVKGVSEGIGRNDAGRVERTINTSVAIALAGGAALAILALATFWLGASSFLSRMGDAELVKLTGIAAAVLVWLEQLDNVVSSAIKGAEHFAQAARVEIASKTGHVLAAALVLFASPTLEAVYVTMFVVAVLRLVAKVLVMRRLLGVSRLRPSFAGAKHVFHFAKWGWLQGMGGVMFGVADRMLVGSLLGASSLAYYSVASQLAMQVHGVSAAALSVVFPKVSRMLESGGHFSLWRVVKMTMTGNIALSTSLAAVLIVFGRDILHFWVGTEVAVAAALLLPWLVLAYWILSLNTVLYYVLLGMGRVRFVGLTAIASGVLALAAMYVAMTRWGLIGAPIGRISYALMSLILVLPLAEHFLRKGDVHFRAAPVDSPAKSEILP